MRLDMTINIPTLLSMLGSIIAITAAGITLYAGIKERVMTSEFEIAKLSQRVEKNEAAVNALRAEQEAKNATLRAEMKGDIAEIKDMLNRLIFVGPQPQRAVQQQQLNEWRK